jgi:hypothetical protein
MRLASWTWSTPTSTANPPTKLKAASAVSCGRWSCGGGRHRQGSERQRDGQRWMVRQSRCKHLVVFYGNGGSAPHGEGQVRGRCQSGVDRAPVSMR